jgi:oxygen-independent coproporphyrinogen-3 oxidase
MPCQNIPLSLYIHLPWCVKKCPYCDFNSHALRQELPERDYIDALLNDLIADLPLINTRPIVSIFMGGGTPSLFSGTAIQRLLDGVRQHCQLSDTVEITLEANPGTVEQENFYGYRAAGVNRLSLGIQSFNSQHLKKLGRIHGSNEAIQAVHAAKKAGFTNFNIDLMHGLPEQTVADAVADLQQAIALEPTHISWYQLTLEPNTLFYVQPPILPDDEKLWDIQTAGQALLAQKHYQQYEVSAYAQTGKQCQHNLNYWQFGDYLGIGAGAHSKITLDDGRIIRSTKTKHPKDYLNPATPFMSEQHNVSQQQKAFEYMLNALRLYQPISLPHFTERTGLTLQHIEPALIQAQQKGLLQFTDKTIQLTEQGHLFVDEITQLFL